jgi:hypothetical protein
MPPIQNQTAADGSSAGDIGTKKKTTENGLLLNTTKGILVILHDANGNGTISLTTDEWNIGSPTQ